MTAAAFQQEPGEILQAAEALPGRATILLGQLAPQTSLFQELSDATSNLQKIVIGL
jgi:hypothetical protein